MVFRKFPNVLKTLRGGLPDIPEDLAARSSKILEGGRGDAFEPPEQTKKMNGEHTIVANPQCFCLNRPAPHFILPTLGGVLLKFWKTLRQGLLKCLGDLAARSFEILEDLAARKKNSFSPLDLYNLYLYNQQAPSYSPYEFQYVERGR